MDESHTFRTQDARLQAGRGTSPSVRFVLIALLGAFVLGGAAVWALGRSGWFDNPVFAMRAAEDSAVPDEAVALPEPSPSASETASAAQTRQAAAQVAQVAEQQGGIDQRVAAMEQRLARLDLQAQAASGNAARAEGLLIAFAARRAIERGAPLGYLGDQLRLRFGDARPNAVQTILDASQDPVTLDQLLARLEGLGPTLMDAPADEGPLQWLGRELSALFVIRSDETASPAAERRMERARLFLESGRTELAISEVRNMPNAAEAQQWLADAERYAAAQRALELLETTAVMEPRELRDGQGKAVEQLSPVSGD